MNSAILNKTSERRALGLILLLVTIAVAVPLLGWLLRPQSALLHARMAESGGWAPENLVAEAGQPLHLRLTSDDVLHSFAIGQSDQPPVDVAPGEITNVTLTFDRPGKYVFYCTRWCGLNHWRMRGVIEVTASSTTSSPEDEASKAETPLYITLGLNPDARRAADAPLPKEKPSTAAGAGLNVQLPEDSLQRDTYLSHSPMQIFMELKATPGIGQLSDQEIWNLVASVWDSNISSEALENGRQLYATNCAACHGEQGKGDGVFAAELAKPTTGEHAGVLTGEMTQPPADFIHPEQMLTASPALLQGKILRGGMGTGMPYWGPIFTEEQTWDLVAYLWQFQFDLEAQP